MLIFFFVSQDYKTHMQNISVKEKGWRGQVSPLTHLLAGQV